MPHPQAAYGKNVTKYQGAAVSCQYLQPLGSTVFSVDTVQLP